MPNHDRANYGLAALQAGTPDYSSNDQQTSLIDTLANLMHEANRIGLDFNVAVASATTHYYEEVAEEDTDKTRLESAGVLRDGKIVWHVRID